LGEGQGEGSYIYDTNGNMTCRAEDGDVFIQAYNAENRISGVEKFDTGDCTTHSTQLAAWNFGYDGDGTRTAQLYTPYVDGVAGTPVVSAYFFGGSYEITGTLSGETFTLTGSTKYYSLAGQSIAMRDSTGLQYFLTDHLGSVMAVLGSNGTLISEQRYLPFGGVREDVGSITETDFGYTGQRDLAGLGLMDYKARFYSSALGRFIQPDTISPNMADPQSWNRFSYVLNNPMLHADPTGHDIPCGAACGGAGMALGGAVLLGVGLALTAPEAILLLVAVIAYVGIVSITQFARDAGVFDQASVAIEEETSNIKEFLRAHLAKGEYIPAGLSKDERDAYREAIHRYKKIWGVGAGEAVAQEILDELGKQIKKGKKPVDAAESVDGPREADADLENDQPDNRR